MQTKTKLHLLFLALLLFILAALLPGAALAADGEAVLTSIGHEDAVGDETPSGANAVTLTLPYEHSDTLDLANSGLEIDYDANAYTSVIPSFESGSQATVGGGPVEMTVSYIKAGDATSTIYTTTYYISVDKEAYVAPDFSGSISQTVYLPNDITFDGDAFAAKYDANNGEDIGSIAISGSNLSCGTLKYNGSGYNFGEIISIANIDSGKLTFDSEAAGSVSYLVTAYDSSGAEVDGTVTLNITIREVSVPTISSSVTKSVAKGSSITFTLSDFSSCYNLNNGTLSNIEITPTNTSYGTWYNGSTSFTGATTFTSTTIGNLKFTGTSVGTATFTWRVANQAGYSSSSGSGTITVSYSVSNISYTVDAGERVTFDDDDFDNICDNVTGKDLNYVKFTLPSSSKGILYYNTSTKVSASTKYYMDSASYLKNVSFLADDDYEGTFYISYTGYDEKGTSYTGQIKITVNENDSDSDYIVYTVDAGKRVTFDVDDFEDACDEANSEDLDYVKFTLPASSKGILYYSTSTKVSASTKYYADSSYYLKNVSFVADDDYEGTFYISYTGYDEEGDSFSGKIKITVGDDDDSDYIVYTCDAGEEVEFDVDDFEDACDEANSEDLDYVKFTLPASSKGILYYNYTSSSSYGSKVSASTKYYADSSYYLKNVSFVADDDYEGTFYISYTGYDEEGDSFSGKIKITVDGDSNSTSKNITYSSSGGAVTFSASDFNTVCDNVTDETLSYVKFTLPSTTYGKLYYNYTSASSYDSAVSTSTKYYKSTTPSLAKVCFVPTAGYSGTVTISYTGYNTDGDSYTGTVKITVTAAATETTYSSYFSDINKNYSWAATQIDYLYKNGVVKGTSTSASKSQYSPGSNISRGDFMLMLYRAFNLSSKTTAGTNFSDVPSSSYYYEAIAVAKYLGIAKGGSNNKFSPTSSLTREDAMVLVLRTMEVSKITLTTGTSSDLTSYSDKSQISDYAATAVATLIKAGIIQGDGKNINPDGNLSRAEMAVILYRALTTK